MIPLLKKRGLTPAYNWDFLTSLPDDFIFNRASMTTGASYFDATPIMDFAGTDEPRHDHDLLTGSELGLLMEDQSENLIPQSSSLDETPWVADNGTVLSDVEASPDGSINTDGFQDSSTDTFHRVGLNTSFSSSTDYSLCFFVKKGARRYIDVRSSALGSFFNLASFDLEDLVVTWTTSPSITASIEPSVNGWLKCTVRFFVTTFTSGAVYFVAADTETTSDNISTYLGDGTVAFYLWGASLEKATNCSSLIQTTTTTVTRPKDLCVATGLTKTPRAFVLEAIPRLIGKVGAYLICISDGDDPDNCVGLYVNSSEELIAHVKVGGLETASINLGTVISDQKTKVGMSWSGTSVSACKDGGTVQTATGTMPAALDTVRLASNAVASDVQNGWYQNHKLWDITLTSAQLQSEATL